MKMNSQQALFWALLILALWLLFGRKKEGMCGMCGQLA